MEKQEAEISAHFLVTRKGNIYQFEATYKEPFLIARDHIIGHYEVDTVNRDKSDPGFNFPWEELMTDLKAWDKKRKEPVKPMEPPKEPAQDRFNGLMRSMVQNYGSGQLQGPMRPGKRQRLQ